jgi:hypothetical protein
MFCAPALIFGGTEGVGSCFHVLRSRTRFRRCGGRPISFSCFALLNSFSAVPRTSGLVLMFCALVLIFSGTEGVGYRFHVLQSRTQFRRYRGRRPPFSCFTLPNSFSTVSRASDPVFMFCACATLFRAHHRPEKGTVRWTAEELHGDLSKCALVYIYMNLECTF